jgi:hypothetical protein
VDEDVEGWRGTSLALAAGNPLDFLTSFFKSLTQTFGIVKLVDQGYRMFADIFKKVKQNLSKTIGLNDRIRAILIDRDCNNCDVWVRCTTTGKVRTIITNLWWINYNI